MAFISLGNINCQESKNQDILQILNNKGIGAKQANTLPLWGKYTYDARSKIKRGFLLFDDGSIYNYSSSAEFPDDEWKNWGKIDHKFILKIKEKLTDMEKNIDSESLLQVLDSRSIMIQYHFESISTLAIISKSYQSATGKLLESINNIINEGLAARVKN